MIRIPYLTEALGVLLLLAVGFGVVQTFRLDSAKDYHREFVMENQANLIELGVQLSKEKASTERALAEQGVRYEQGIEAGKRLGDAVVADLRANNSELRIHWRNALRRASEAEAAITSGGDNETPRTVSADLAGFVQRAATADAAIVSLQDTVNSYLCQINKEPYPGYQCSK